MQMDNIYDTVVTSDFNYILVFCLTLFLVNTIAKLIFDDGFELKTRTVILFTSAVVTACFNYFFGDLWNLLWNAFACFGFFDIVGRHIESAILFLYAIAKNGVSKTWQKLKDRYKFKIFNPK
jgi:hypothetical protein